MATKTIITKIDDIDGSPAHESFTFSWQGNKYTIDLSKAHSAEIKADFDKWVQVAHRERGGARPTRSSRAATTAEPKAAAKQAAPKGRPAKSAKAAGPSPADVRAWALAKGIEIASRGRIAPAIVAQYLAEKAFD